MQSVSHMKSNAWREFYNPLRGMSVPRLVMLLEAGERGEYADLQWFYQAMERSDVMIYSVIQRRRAALLSCDWRIGVIDGVSDEEQSLAQEQAAFLTELYEGIENLREALAFLHTGFFRGYAHVEKHGDDVMIERLEPVEQWFWVRDGMYGEWRYNREARSGVRRGLGIDRDGFVIFEDVALNRMLAVLYLRRTLAMKDWDSYLTVYGIPSFFLVGPPGATGDKEKEYQSLAEALVADGRGYLPNGSDIKYATGGSGKIPFMDALDYSDRQVALAGTGGLLTMLTAPGSGTLAGGAHEDSFREIARGDAARLSEVFQRDVDRVALERVFPGERVMAYFEMVPREDDVTGVEREEPA